MESSLEIQKIAQEIQRRRLNMPAIFILEMYKPLSKIFAVLSIAFSPLLIPIVGAKLSALLTEVLNDREKMEELICLLEKDSPEELKAPSLEAVSLDAVAEKV